MRNFTTYIRTIVLAGLVVLGALSASAQSYTEGADLNGQTFTLNAATTYNYSGTVQTPTDQQDGFTVTVAAGYQITDVSYVHSTNGSPINFFTDFNGTSGSASSGTLPLSYPVGAGSYSILTNADFSVGNAWSVSITVVSTGGPVAPANDDVCSAIPLSIGNNGPYDNTNATTQAGEPANGGSSVWFTLTAPASGHVTILAPDFNTELSLYDLLTCSDFTTYALIANDDNSGAAHGGVAGSAWVDAVCLTPGHTYYLQLSGTGGATGSTDIDVASVANQAPTLSACPANISGCSATPTFTAPTATDPEGCSVTVTPDHASGSTFPTGTTTVTYTATDNLGATTTCSFTVTVISPTVNAVSDQTVCNGSATTAVTFSGTATTYNWTGTDGSIGIPASGSGNIPSFNAINTGTTPVIDVITVTPVTGACSGPSKSFNITVNPTPTVNAVYDAAYCNGAATSAITFSGAIAGTIYDWIASTDIGGGTGNTGNIPSFTATNTGATPISSNYQVTPAYTNNATVCFGTPDNFILTVNPQTTFTQNPSICQGASFVAGGNTYTTPGTYTDVIPAGNMYGCDSTVTTNLTVNQYVAPSATATPSTICLSDTSRAVAFASASGFIGTYTPANFTFNTTSDGYFDPSGAPASVLVGGGDDGSFSFGISTAEVVVPVSGNVSFTWNYTDNDFLLGQDVPFYSINGTPYTFADYTGATPTETGTATIAVNAGDVFGFGIITLDNFGGNAEVILSNFTAPDSGNITWYDSPIGGAVVGTGDTLVVVPATAGVSSYYAEVSGGAPCITASRAQVTITTVAPSTFTQSPVICMGDAVVVGAVSHNANGTYIDTLDNAAVSGCDSIVTTNLTVNPIPTVDPTADLGVCNGSSASVPFTGTVPGTVYSWTGTDGAMGIPTSGTGDIPTFTGTNGGTTPVSDTIIVTPSYSFGGTTCTGTPDTFIITINPTPTVDPSADQVICNDNFTTPVNFTGAAAGTDYLWTSSNTTIGLPASGSGNIASFLATNGSAVVITDTIIVTPSYTNAGTTCTGTPDTFFITVNPTPDVNPSADQAVCNTEATAPILFTGKVTGTAFDWVGTNSTIGLPASGNGDIASFTAINTGNVPVTDTIIVTPSYTNAGVTCVGAQDTFFITVNPTPIITASADQSLCNRETTNAVTFTSTVAGTTFAWTNSNSTTGLAASGAGNIAPFVAVNTTTTDVIDTIVVTPTSAEGCAGAADTFTITIHPSPYINLGPNVTTCGGNVQIDAGNPGSTYLWSNGATSQIDTVSASGAYYVTVTTAFGCIDSAGPKNIYIKPAPVVNLGPDSAYCGGPVTLNAGNPGDAYLWSDGSANQTLVVTTTGDYGVIVTDTASGCFGSDTIHITINGLPVVNLGPDTTLCGGSLTLMAGDPINTYLWSPGGSTSNTLTVTSSGTYSVTVRNPNGCTASDAITVTIYSKPNLGADQADSICQGATADLYSYFQGSGLTLTFNTPTPGAVDQGVYSVVGTNANGCSDTAFVTITYRVKPDLGADKTDSTCPGYTYNLRNLFPNNGYSTYSWSGTFTDTAVGPGSYTLIVSNASGCTDTVVATILNGSRPNLGGNKTDSVCSGTTYDLTTLYPNTGYTSYTWTGVADSSAVGAGTYQLVVSNGRGCTDTAYATITNRARAVVTFTMQNGLCSTVPAFLLTGGSPAGGTYFVNGVITNTFDPALTGSGPQRVVYVYTNAGGCVDSAVQFITVYPQPNVTNTTLPVACSNSQAIDLDQYFSPIGGTYTGAGISGQYFYPSLAGVGATPITYIYTDSHGCMDTGNASITVTNEVQVSLHTTTVNFTACAGSPVTFIANGATDYQFFVNGVAVTGISDTDTYTSTTLQDHDQVTVVGSNACSTDTSDFIIIDINQAPVVNAGMDTTIELGQTAQLNGTATGGTGNLTYSWNPGANLNFNNVPNPKYNGPDTVTFVLTVTDINGCFGTDTVTVNVHVPDNVVLPNILTPNGDGQNDLWVLNSKINLAGSHLVIFNRWGEKVFEADSYANNWKGTYMNTNDKLPDGTYYYVLKVPAQNNHEYTGPINLLSTQK